MLDPTAPTARRRPSPVDILGKIAPPGVICRRSGYALPPSAHPRRQSHPDCRSRLILIVAPHRDMLKILAAPRLDENFCREAQRRRDFAIGTPGRKTIPELIDAAKGKLRPGEQVVGTWVDRDHMCGVVTITRRANAHSHFAMCSDGSSTRRGDGPVDEAAAALKQIKAPAGASRAWHTPGLKRREIVLLGEKTVEYLDRKGHRYDLNRFVEMREGRLLGYQSGVGLDRDGPWLRAEPWKAN
jgi:hypothetical protein